MTTHITSRKEFKNPAIYDKLIEDFGVNEYGTNYPCTGGDTIPLDPSDYYDKLCRYFLSILCLSSFPSRGTN